MASEPTMDNRLLEALLLHTKQEVAYRVNNPAARKNDPQSRQLELDHYHSVLEAFRGRRNLTRAERSTRRYLRHAIRQNKLRGKPLLYQWAYRVTSWIVSVLLLRRSGIVRHRRELAGVEQGTAVQQNVHRLGNQLREAGFNQVPEQALQERLRHRLPRFDLRYADPEHPKTDFILHFQKLSGADAYFFAGFDAIDRATLQDVIKRTDTNPAMRFSMNDGPAFSAREAAHMAGGRPVLKEVDGQPLWFRSNGSSPQGEYRPGFDLARSAAQLPVREMKNPTTRDNLLAALRSGARREVTLQFAGGWEEKAYLSVAADLSGVQLHTKEGKYFDLDDYMRRFSLAKQSHEKAQNQKLQPVNKKSRSRATV